MLRVLKNRVLRRMFGPTRDEVREEWRKLHNEELNYQYSSPNIIRKLEKNEMNEACSTYGVRRGAYRLWVGKPVGKRPHGIRGRRWRDNIKTHREEVGWGHGLD